MGALNVRPEVVRARRWDRPADMDVKLFREEKKS